MTQHLSHPAAPLNCQGTLRLDLGNRQINATLTGAACVRSKLESQGRSGKPYLTVELTNALGSMTAKVWSDALPQWSAIAPGDPVHVRATVKRGYNGGPPELHVGDVAPLPKPHPVQLEVNARCPVPRAELERRFEVLTVCLTPAEQALVDVVLEHVGRERYWTAPAAKAHHHAYVGGLAEHSIEVAELAIRIAQQPPYAEYVDRGALVVGALLHDVAKVDEYVWEGEPIALSRIARLRYHTARGSELVAVALERARERVAAAGITPLQVASLQHVIESHHDKAEWGSPVAPHTIEALVVHLADMTSARLRGMADDLLSAEPDAEGWVTPIGWRREPVLWLDRIGMVLEGHGAPLTSRVMARSAAPERAMHEAVAAQGQG